MALRGPESSGPSSRGPLEEAGAAAEEREAPAEGAAAAAAAPLDDEEDDGRGLLRWDGFSAWLHCVCVVGFDLELGQAVEVRPGRSGVPPPCPGSRPGGLCRVCGLCRPGPRPPRIWAWLAAPPPLGAGCGLLAVPLGASWAAAGGEKFSQGPS